MNKEYVFRFRTCEPRRMLYATIGIVLLPVVILFATAPWLGEGGVVVDVLVMMYALYALANWIWRNEKIRLTDTSLHSSLYGTIALADIVRLSNYPVMARPNLKLHVRNRRSIGWGLNNTSSVRAAVRSTPEELHHFTLFEEALKARLALMYTGRSK
jgi:hypothetical protein